LFLYTGQRATLTSVEMELSKILFCFFFFEKTMI
jgi:hypothetical protein